MLKTIKGARIDAGLSREFAAKKLEIKVWTLDRWESGETKIPIDKAQLICQVYQLKAEELISMLSDNTNSVE